MVLMYFFVLSGYLLYRGYILKERQDTFVEYINRRFIRIFPSLIVVLFAWHLVSALILDPQEWTYFCDSAVASLLGYANVYFDAVTKDYFATDAARAPLTHLWYLSVILHFYLLFAVVFILPNKVSLKLKWMLMLLLSIVSVLMAYCWMDVFAFIYKLFDIPQHDMPINSYYWTIARIWECVAGMAIIYLPRIKSIAWNTTCFVIGVVLIVVPSFVDAQVMQANYLAVMGTMLVVAYIPTKKLSFLYENRLVQFIGKISFSLYLWHYVVFYFWKHYSYWEYSVWYQCVLMLVFSIVLSYFAWRIVERRKFSNVLVIFLWAGLLVASYYVPPRVRPYFLKFHNIGQTHTDNQLINEIRKYKHRSLKKTDYAYLDEEARFRTWPEDSSDKVWFLGNIEKSPSFVLMGDSHAQAYASGLDLVLRDKEISGIYVCSRPLPFCDNDYFVDKPIPHRNMTEQVMEYIKQKTELNTVVATCHWGGEFTRHNGTPEVALRRFCEEINKMGKKLIFITDNPTIKEPNVVWYVNFCRSHGLSPREDMLSCTQEEYEKFNKKSYETLSELENKGLCHVISVQKYLFHNGKFKALNDEGILLMYDTNHLTKEGVLLLSLKIQDELYQLLK